MIVTVIMNLGLNTNEMEVPTGFIVHPLKKLNYFQMQVAITIKKYLQNPKTFGLKIKFSSSDF